MLSYIDISYIDIRWTIEDVKSLDDKLTDAQCVAVLEYVHDNHDANFGVNWETIENAILDLARIQEYRDHVGDIGFTLDVDK